MLISEIREVFPALYRIILHNIKTECGENYRDVSKKIDKDELIEAFTWDITNEGHSFWSEIYECKTKIEISKVCLKYRPQFIPKKIFKIKLR